MDTMDISLLTAAGLVVVAFAAVLAQISTARQLRALPPKGKTAEEIERGFYGYYEGSE